MNLTRRRIVLFITILLFNSSCTTNNQPTPLLKSPSPRTQSPTPTSTDPVISGFIAFGDFGGGEAQDEVANAMEEWVASRHRVDALVTTGDNVYEDGNPRLFKSQLDIPYKELRKTRPLWVTLGNHDVQKGYGDEQLDYLGLPDLPYAKELPGIQLLFLDANTPDKKQAKWLESKLSKPGPQFRAVLFHQAAFSCGIHGSTEEVDENWVPIIEKHEVSLVLNGHDHHYERFLSSNNVTYVVTGGGGKDLYPIRPNCKTEPRHQESAIEHHFVGVEVREDSLTLSAIAEDGSLLDQVVLRDN